MSRNFYAEFKPNDFVQDTMEDMIEGSLVALQSNFNDPGDVPSGDKRVGGMLCSNRTDFRLKLRNQNNTAWLNIYDFANQEVLLTDGQVTTAKISSSARKPTIVAGESISPSSCTLQSKFKNVSVPSAPNELFQWVAGFGRSGLTSWEAQYTTRIFVPSDAGTLYVVGRLTNASLQFVLGGSTSNSTQTIAGPNAWSPEVWLDVSGKSGWNDLEVKTRTTVTGIQVLSGVACRWEH